MNTRVGLFFGTFNPFHNGHMALCGAVLASGLVDRLWIVPSPQSPFKTDDNEKETRARLHGVERIVELLHEPRLAVCCAEYELPIPSYTWRTLEHLQTTHPSLTFALVMGGDSLAALPTWARGEWILESFTIITYPREPLPPEQLRIHRNVRMLNAPLLPISSTLVRNLIQRGENPRFYLPLVGA